MFYDNLIAFLPEMCAWLTGAILGSTLMYIYMDLKVDEAKKAHCESLIEAHGVIQDVKDRGHKALKAQKMYYTAILKKRDHKLKELKARSYEARIAANLRN